MDYFTIISQLTQIDDSFSESKVVKIGVPKRLLGPRLFTSYINDLSDSIRSGDIHTCRRYSHLYSSTDEVAIALEILDQLQSRCLMNRLIIHEGKSNTIIFDTKAFVEVLALSLGR